MEYTGSVRTLARKLYALVCLWLYPLRLDTKSSTFYLFVGLQKVAMPVAVVEDLGIGLQ
jgi:hypothetical protein